MGFIERILDRVLPTDFRGWLGLGLFIQSSTLFAMIALADKDLAGNQGFMTLAAAVIVTGWVGGAAAFAYAAGKSSEQSREIAGAALGIARESQRQQSNSAPAATTTVDELSEDEKGEIERLIADNDLTTLVDMAKDLPEAAGKTDLREIATLIVKARRA